MDRTNSILIVQALLLIIFYEGGEAILEGAPVLGNGYPFMVLIRKELNDSTSIDVCSGIILNKNCILTLATCIYINFMNNPLEAKIYLGSNEKSLQHRYSIKTVNYHPDFELQAFPKNNLALLHLQSPLVFSETIKSISLNYETIEKNSRCSISGWGSLTMIPIVMENALHYDNMTVSDQVDCKSQWSPYVTDANLCTQYEAGRGLAYGDMGGALVMQGTLIGVAGFADVSGMQLPDVYWRIGYFKEWIENSVGK